MQSYFNTKAFVLANLTLPTTASGSEQSKVKRLDRSVKESLVWTSILPYTPIRASQTGRMSRNFSRPFTARYTQGTPISARASPLSDMSSYSPRSSSLDVPYLVRGRRLTIADSKASVPAGNSTAARTQAPQLGHLDFEFSSSTDSSESDFASDLQQRDPQPAYSYHAYSNSSLSSDVPPPLPFKKGRFYSNALSSEDKAALVHGELNHNLKVWSPTDVVMHHESRKSLVPQGPGIDKLRKMEAMASIERDKQHSQQVLNREVRGSTILPSFRLTNDKGEDDNVAYHRQATQSMYDLRSPSAPLQRSLPLPPTLARKFSFDATTPPPLEAKGIRPVSTDDYFSHRPSRPSRPRSMLSPPSPDSRESSRGRSPLSQGHRHNPNTTFDSMLAPHKSGKGEVFRGSPHAKKAKASASDASSSPGQSPVRDKKQCRFSKMPSMISLKKRSSRYDLRKNGADDDIPEVPSLPSPLP
jgi:hypothetical protein